MIVLDTHALIWYAAGKKIRPAANAAITAALDDDAALVSSISAWEIGMLVAKQRIDPGVEAEDYIYALFRHEGITEEPVSSEIAIRAAFLPGEFHGDPADRIIVATACARKAALVTRDERIVSYLRATRLTPFVMC